MADDRESRILPLAPRDDLCSEGQFRVYHKVLTQAFQDPQICNIALSGSLGSGKSSILRSFDRSRNRNRRRFLYVSLTEFSKDHLDVEHLENSVLSQLLSYCTQNDLPEGSFTGIPEKFHWMRACAVWLSAMSFITFVLLFDEQFGALAALFGVSEECRSLIHLLLYLLAGISLGVGAYIVLLQCLSRLRLSKLTLKAAFAETEVVLGTGQTSLDRNKFELTYAMSRIARKIDHTVVFEDFERLDKDTAVGIMEKLRELNFLTNNHIRADISRNKLYWLKHLLKVKLQIHARGLKTYEAYEADSQSVGKFRRRILDIIFASNHVRFVYAISEETINVEHRVKFYDCIIPVVPASNPLNGRDKLKEILSNLGFHQDGQYTARLVDVLSPVMVDYRTMLTLQNEFRVLWGIYASRPHKKDTSEDLDKATMLAIVAYKILFPKEFEDALSVSGSGMLKRFMVEVSEFAVVYSDVTYHQKCVFAVASLFDFGLLDEFECLRMVIGEDQLLDHWLQALGIALQTLDNSNSQSIVQSLTEQVKVIYQDGSAEHRKSCARFLKIHSDILSTLLDKPQQFSLVVNCFAMISSNDIRDWKWLFKDVPDKNMDASEIKTHKAFFTRCIVFLSQTEPDNPARTRILSFSEDLYTWCLKTLYLMGPREMADTLKWDALMGDMLGKILVKKEPGFAEAHTSLSERIVTGDISLRSILQRIGNT